MDDCHHILHVRLTYFGFILFQHIFILIILLLSINMFCSMRLVMYGWLDKQGNICQVNALSVGKFLKTNCILFYYAFKNSFT